MTPLITTLSLEPDARGCASTTSSRGRSQKVLRQRPGLTSQDGSNRGLAKEDLAALGPELGGTRDFVLDDTNQLLRRCLGWSGLEQAPKQITFEAIPLTIHAPSGYGKSHLLAAIAALWLRAGGGNRVIQISGADLARAYATALKLGDVPQFQQRLQRADLLLIDRLDELQRKAGAQRLLAAIIDHRQLHHRPMVTAAWHPLRLLNLSARLISRLAGGLVIPLELPGPAARQEILLQFARERELSVSPDALAHLSLHEPATIPQLTGILLQSAAHHSLGSVIEEHDIRNVVRADVEVPLDPRQIIRVTADFFGLKPRNLTGSSRRTMDVLARGIAMHLMRHLTQASFQQIGQHFGRRDHTTVMHACKKIDTSRQSDTTVRNAILEINRHLKTAVAAATAPSPPKSRRLSGSRRIRSSP